MDIDVAPQHELHEEVSEDLIDYDDDPVEQQHSQSLPNDYDEKKLSAPELSIVDISTSEQPAEKIFLDLTTAGDDDAADAQAHPEESLNIPSSATNDGDARAHDEEERGDHVVHLSNGPQDGHGDDTAGDSYEDDNGAPSVPTGDDDLSLHEIDYDNQDDIYNLNNIANEGIGTEGDEVIGTIQEADIVGDVIQAGEEPPGDLFMDPAVPVVHEDMTEIHWEQDQADDDGSLFEVGDDAQDKEIAEPQDTLGDELIGENLEDVEPVWQGNPRDELIEESEDEEAVAEQIEDETVAKQSPEDTDALHDVQDSESLRLPQVTVQYKGDEFPMFSSSSEGFFSEISVLDDNMEALMAGFRAELVNEISTNDELVFQVDELGLEISESHIQTSLSAVTLRQVLDIFDLLVKNQDPNGSRVLYTYLSTRPNTSKRFDFLAESAAAGKGLDEIIHLFHPSVPHETQDNILDMPDSNERDSDSHELAAGSDEGDNDDEETFNQRHQPLEEQNLSAENAPQDDGMDNVATQQSRNEHGDGAGAFMSLDEAARATDKGSSGEVAVDFLDHTTANEPTDTDAGLLLALDFEGEAVDSGPDIAESGITNTSTTNTLQDDVETLLAPFNEEFDQEPTIEVRDPPAAEEELVNEIDWRDEGEGDDEVEEIPSGAGKRGHADAELGTEDENDVKRRRS